MNLRTNFLQEKGCDRGLSPDLVHEKLKDEPLQFKEHEDYGLEHNYRILLGNYKYLKFSFKF